MSEQNSQDEREIEEQQRAEAEAAEAREIEEQEEREAQEAMEREQAVRMHQRRTLLSTRQAQALMTCVQALDALGVDSLPEDEWCINDSRDRVLRAVRANFFDPPEPMFGPTFWEAMQEQLPAITGAILAMSGASSSVQSAPAMRPPLGSFGPSPIVDRPGLQVGQRVMTSDGIMEVVRTPRGFALKPVPAEPTGPTHYTATADGQVTPPSDVQKQRLREYFEQIAPTLGRLDLSYVEELLISEMVKRDQEELGRKNRQG